MIQSGRYIAQAPLAVVVAMEKSVYAVSDASRAIQSMILTAWAEGVGERLTPVDVPRPWYLVVSPGFGVTTAKIFNARDLTRNTPAITIRDFLEGRGQNDCEAVVRGIYPQIGELLDWLGHRGPSRLTGTGSCVFTRFATRQEATGVLDELPAPWQGFVARGLNRSPLLDRLHEEETKLKVKRK